MSLVNLLLGKPLTSDEEGAEKVGPAAGVSVFGLDALGSAAYGPEAALTVLLTLGLAGIPHLVPITGCIIVLLTIVYFSYRQTIATYPTGGGAYTVASQNLGVLPGLLAAAALMVDYVLVVAVGISAGVGALISAVPSWQPHTLPLCLGALMLLTIVNLRGTRDAGAAFLIPTYLFVGCLIAVLGLGIWKTVLSGGHPSPVHAPSNPGPPHEAITWWIWLRAFSNGCTAMTGVEAVSNGVAAFRDPQTQTARRTLSIIVAILALLLTGIAFLCRAYVIGATEPGQPGYQSVLSQLTAAVAGKGWFYKLTIGSILLVLVLQANTAFADFPRLCRAIARHRYLPRSFANRGRRLVYSQGIYALVFLAGWLLLLSGGVTDHLIPLFAVGALMAFTLSQAGMVAHWRRTPAPHARLSMLINGLGAVATAITAIIVIVSKFTEGAWITLLLLPGLILLMKRVRHHYDRADRELATHAKLRTANLCPPLVVVPIDQWSKVSERALRFALTISHDVTAVHVDCGEDSGRSDRDGRDGGSGRGDGRGRGGGDGGVSKKSKGLARLWRTLVDGPAQQAGLPTPELVILKSPYRYILTPTIDYILELERRHPDRQIAVVVPNLVERRWFQRFLHNHHGELLTALLLLKGNQRIVIINVPWYLEG